MNSLGRPLGVLGNTRGVLWRCLGVPWDAWECLGVACLGVPWGALRVPCRCLESALGCPLAALCLLLLLFVVLLFSLLFLFLPIYSYSSYSSYSYLYSGSDEHLNIPYLDTPPGPEAPRHAPGAWPGGGAAQRRCRAGRDLRCKAL